MKKAMESMSEIQSCDQLLNAPRHAVTVEKYNPADAAKNIMSKKVPKSEAEIKQIRESLTSIFLFDSLSAENITEVIEYMFARNIQENDQVITEDDTGDYFYIISKGKFVAYQQGVLVKKYDNKGYFGELSLMYNTPRSATIKATTPGKLWALDSDCFRRFLLQHAYERRSKLDNLVKQSQIFMKLPNMEKLMLIDSLSLTNFSNEPILNEGSKSERFYFVEIGCVEISVKNNSKKTLKIGEFFGDECLLFSKPSSFTARAKGNVSLGFLEKESFNIIFTPIMSEMKANCTNFIKSVT